MIKSQNNKLNEKIRQNMHMYYDFINMIVYEIQRNI
jgi:FtsH-binding integral membrane protein